MRLGRRRSLAVTLAACALLALRFYRLDDVPVLVYCDEAFHAYEACSLLETGRDSRGVLLPFFFDNFGLGWGEPLYACATVPAVWALGLRPMAPRAVAALAMARSPWSFHLSRVGFQASLLPLALAAGFRDLARGFSLLHRRALPPLRGTRLRAALLLALLVIPAAGFSMTAAGRQRLSAVSIMNHPDAAGGGIVAAAGLAARHYIS